MDYFEMIQHTPLVACDKLDLVTTTGDVDYPGTTLEVSNKDNDLFEFVVDEMRNGEKQVVFYPQANRYRLSLETLERIISIAKEEVKYMKDILDSADDNETE